jgi:glyoxylate/hydroxypyruvate reductase A
MALLFSSQADDPFAWTAALKRQMPDLDVRVWPDVGDVRDIDVALLWRYPKGDLKRYPNLKLMCSLGAGVEHILEDPDLPDVPLTRIVDPMLGADMAAYVTAAVLRHHCDFPDYERFQRERLWKKVPRPHASERTVGIMGLGEMGRACAAALRAHDFPVLGWSRSPRTLAGVECFAGAAALPAFLARTQILVCLLPLTRETRGIIDAKLLRQLPRGAFVVNAARGGHVVDADLIAALDLGHLAGATLDVFEPEPLPPASPLWAHPNILVTPHVASLTDPDTSCAQIAENVRRLRAGEKLLYLVDRARGY